MDFKDASARFKKKAQNADGEAAQFIVFRLDGNNRHAAGKSAHRTAKLILVDWHCTPLPEDSRQ